MTRFDARVDLVPRPRARRSPSATERRPRREPPRRPPEATHLTQGMRPHASYALFASVALLGPIGFRVAGALAVRYVTKED